MIKTSTPTARIPDLLTRAEAAAKLRRSVKTLANWASLGTGPDFYRYGDGAGGTVYSEAAITEWLTSQHNMRGL